jgi:hypothetical protein
MNSDSYHQARNTALKDLAEAVNDAKLIEQRIARLKQTIASLDALIEGEEAATETKQKPRIGITDACRQALKIANSPRTAIEVRDWLASSGYELPEQENALASIHTVLKRLVKAGEAANATNAEGKATYEWIGERSDSFTTALQQFNYHTAKQVSEAVRSIAASPKVMEEARRISDQAARAIARYAAIQSRTEKVQRTLAQVEKTQKTLDSLTKKD